MPGEAQRKSHGLRYRCTEGECTYAAFRYEVRQHFLDRHVSLKVVPYYCVGCGERCATKQKADTHLRNRHEGEHFKDLFDGTYQDLTDADYPAEQRLTAEAAAARGKRCRSTEDDRTEEL